MICTQSIDFQQHARVDATKRSYGCFLFELWPFDVNPDNSAHTHNYTCHCHTSVNRCTQLSFAEPCCGRQTLDSCSDATPRLRCHLSHCAGNNRVKFGSNVHTIPHQNLKCHSLFVQEHHRHRIAIGPRVHVCGLALTSLSIGRSPAYTEKKRHRQRTTSTTYILFRHRT